jgi:hypothetical protein
MLILCRLFRKQRKKKHKMANVSCTSLACELLLQQVENARNVGDKSIYFQFPRLVKKGELTQGVTNPIAKTAVKEVNQIANVNLVFSETHHVPSYYTAAGGV